MGTFSERILPIKYEGGLNMMGKQLDYQCHNNTGDGKDITNIIPVDGIDTIDHGYVFGKNITNNNTKGGLNIMGKQLDDQCHNNTGDGKDITNIIPVDGIDTIKKVKKYSR